MVAVVNGSQNAAHAAAVDDIDVAGVTGNVQQSVPDLGGGKKTYSWFVGFAPADRPTYAFAVLTESGEEPGRGDATSASIAGMVLRELFRTFKTKL